MPKFVVTVNRETKLIEDAFKDVGRTARLQKAQYKVFLAIYKSRVNGLFNLLRTQMRLFYDDVKDITQDSFEATDEGDNQYIKKQKEAFEKFMFGSEKTLNKGREYKEFKNDRIIKKITSHLRRGIIVRKEWAIKKTLGEGRVFDFFLRSGINIIWRVEV